MKKLSYPAVAVIVIGALALLLVVVANFPRGDPWQIGFKSSAGRIEISIRQEGLKIHDVFIKTDAPAPVGFKDVEVVVSRRVQLPIGTVKHCDVTRLPGHFSFTIGTHTIDLIPVALGIDGNEVLWKDAMAQVIDLSQSRDTNPQ